METEASTLLPRTQRRRAERRRQIPLKDRTKSVQRNSNSPDENTVQYGVRFPSKIVRCQSKETVTNHERKYQKRPRRSRSETEILPTKTRCSPKRPDGSTIRARLTFETLSSTIYIYFTRKGHEETSNFAYIKTQEKHPQSNILSISESDSPSERLIRS